MPAQQQFLVVNNPKPDLLGLCGHIASAEPFQDASRSSILRRAETYLVQLNRETIPSVLHQAEKTELPPLPGADNPAFLKIRVEDPELHQQLLDRFRETFQISRVRTGFFLRTVLLAYLVHLNAVPESPPEAPAVDRLALNLRLARLLADPSPEAERKLARITALLEGKKEDF